MRKATFITFVHNGERFVESTIKSVLNQSEPDFWYFIRLNACTDGSEEIVRRYASIDDRIVVFKNEVNFITDDGISYEKREFWPEFDSEFIAFVDHDDVLHPHFLKTLYPLGKRFHADLVVGGYTRFDSVTGKAIRDRIPPNFQLEHIEDIAPYFYELFGAMCPLWGKLYDTQMYNQHYEKINSYPKELTTMNDVWIIFSLLKYCQRVVGVDKSLYFYRANQISQFYPEVPHKSRIGEAKFLFDTELSFLKQISCDTEKNITRLYHAHRSRMLDAIDIVKRSNKMTDAEKIDYLQYILYDQHLTTYRNLAMEKIQPRIQDCMRELVESDSARNELWQYYLYRIEYTRLYKIQNRGELLVYLSALLCKDNTLSYGLEILTQNLWEQIPVLDQNKILADIRYVDKSQYPIADIQNEKQRSEDIQTQLGSCMDRNEWDRADSLLQELEKYTLTSEAGLLCRLMLLVNQGDLEDAKRFSYIAQALCPENQYIQKVCCELK